MSRRSTPTYTALAAKLRAERLRQNLTQQALAERIDGTDNGNICGWERGRVVPGLTALIKWAAALGYEIALTPIPDDGNE